MTAEERALALLTGALEIPSPSGEEAAVAAYLVEAMRERGFEAHVDEVDNAVGTIGSGPVKVVLLGHIDTVPGFIPVERRGDALYGRGSVDATGPFCAFVEACAGVGAELGNRLTLTCVGAVEEEVASSRGAHHAFPGVDPDFLIIGEPSGWDAVTLGYKGRLGLVWSVAQEMAHGAGKDPSAADQGFEFWRRVTAWIEGFNGEKKIFDRLDAKILRAHTGDDALEDSFRFRVDLRIPVGFPTDEFSGICAAAAEAAGGRVEVSGEVEAIRSPKNTPLVRAFLKAIRAEGGKPRFKVKTGTADMNLAPRYHPGVPVVTYGPGDSSLDHTPREHIMVSEYQRGIRVLEGCLRALAGEKSPDS